MYTPVAYGALSGGEQGDLFDPIRKTSIHKWYVERGALFENVGQWKRPWYYPHSGESMAEVVNRECLAVRTSAGILDASTLSKIDIQGPDSHVFLNRVYTDPFLKVPVGRCRYGLMLDENGMVIDDGVTGRLGRESLLDVHHHRRRSPHHVLAGTLAPDGMAPSAGLSDLCHRSLGYALGLRSQQPEDHPGAVPGRRPHS